MENSEHMVPASQRKAIFKFGLRLGNPSAERESSISRAEKVTCFEKSQVDNSSTGSEGLQKS